MAYLTRRSQPVARSLPAACVLLAVCMAALPVRASAQQAEPPELTDTVNDFAHVIDANSRASMDRMIRELQQASGDIVVVATVDTFAPYADINEYAVKMFENHGHGIGQRGKDNGLLVVVAVRDRRVKVEVGYDLEQFVTDGFAGSVSRQAMAPQFARGAYGPGLVAGVSQIIGRIASGRGVTLQDVPRAERRAPDTGSGGNIVLALFVFLMVINAIAARLRRRRRFPWWLGPWSGWSSGVGPFGGMGGGFGGGGFGGGGFGGGFGGFGGGRSGGGGGGAGW